MVRFQIRITQLKIEEYFGRGYCEWGSGYKILNFIKLNPGTTLSQIDNGTNAWKKYEESEYLTSLILKELIHISRIHVIDDKFYWGKI